MQSNYAQSCHYVYDDESMYTGAHSVRWYTDNEDGGLITNKFSWDTWGLIPSTAPMVSMPQVYENTIDIPGTNRTVDLSNVLLGFPTFKKRTGSWKFYCDLTKPCKFPIYVPGEETTYEEKCWTREGLYGSLASFFHGQNRKCILIDGDPEYYYQGKFKLGNMTTGKGFPQVDISYTLDPFKYWIHSTHTEQRWDPFDFIDGEVTYDDYNDIAVDCDYDVPYTQATVKYYWQRQIGQAPVFPKIYANVTAASGDENPRITMEVMIADHPKQEFTLHQGWNYDPQFMMVCPTEEYACVLILRGHGSISLDFVPGRL